MDNTDYLSRKAIVKNLTDGLKHYEGRVETLTYRIIERFMEYIKEFPAADVQPIRRGRWIITDDVEHFIAKCSECGRSEDSRAIKDMPYCHCGAKMDLGDEKT